VGGFDRPGLVVGAGVAGGVVSGLVGWALVETDPDRPAEYPSSLDDRRLDARRHSQALLTGARNLLPIAVATLVSPAGAGLLKAAIMPFTPILSLVAGLRPVVLPAMQRAAARGPGGGFEGLVQRLLGWYAALAVVAVSATAALGSVVIDRVGAPASIDGGSLRWGGAIAVMTILSTLLADAIGFGRRPVRPVPVRLGEIGLEWATALAVALVLGSRHVVAGWAVGMALGTKLWLVPGLTDPGPNRR
jgi:hypothetical protein